MKTMKTKKTALLIFALSCAGVALAKTACEFYTEFNSDGNPGLTQSEWTTGFNTSGVGYCRTRATNFFAGADGNHDGIVTKEEASNYWTNIDAASCW